MDVIFTYWMSVMVFAVGFGILIICRTIENESKRIIAALNKSAQPEAPNTEEL